MTPFSKQREALPVASRPDQRMARQQARCFGNRLQCPMHRTCPCSKSTQTQYLRSEATQAATFALVRTRTCGVKRRGRSPPPPLGLRPRPPLPPGGEEAIQEAPDSSLPLHHGGNSSSCLEKQNESVSLVGAVGVRRMHNSQLTTHNSSLAIRLPGNRSKN